MTISVESQNSRKPYSRQFFSSFRIDSQDLAFAVAGIGMAIYLAVTEKEYRQTFKLIKYGLSSEQIADVLEKDPRTIEAWVEAIAEKSKNFHNFVCLLIGITIEFLQMDELWSYLKNKKWINLFDYNYCQFHRSLRKDLTGEKVKFKKRYQEVTPAMKIGLTTSQLNFRFLIISPIPKSG